MFKVRLGFQVLLAIALAFGPSYEQSGRRRTPEAPPPSREPAIKSPAERSTDRVAPKSDSSSASSGQPVPKGGEVKDRLTDQGSATNRFTLANGLTLIVRERYSYPLVSLVLIAQHAGADSWLKRTLLSRLALRLMLQEAAGGSQESLLERWHRLGGVINMRVRDDLAILSISVPRENLVPAIETLTSMISSPVFDASALRRQVTFLDAEMKDHPEELEVSIFGGSGTALTGAPASGPVDPSAMVKALKLEEVQEFIHRTYRASHLTLAVVGAANTYATLDAVQRISDDPPIETASEGTKPKESETASAEAKIAPQSTAPVQSRPTPTQAAPLRILGYQRKATTGGLARIAIGFRVGVAAPTQELPELDLLSTALARGRASRLERALNEGPPLVTDLTCGATKLDGLLWFITSWLCDPKEVESTERIFFQQADRLRREPLSPGEFQRAQVLTEYYLRKERSGLSGEAELLARNQIFSGDFRAADHQLANLRERTAEQLRQAAATVFQYSNIAVEEIRSDSGQSISAEDLAARIVLMAPGIREQQPEAISPRPAEGWPLVEQGTPRTSGDDREPVIVSLQPEPVRDLSVLRGPRAYVREDRSNLILAIGLLFQGGRLLERPSAAGVTGLMLRSMLRGATSNWFSTGAGSKQLIARDIEARLEQMGGEIEIVNEGDFFGLILTTLSRNQDAAMRLLVDLIERPVFDDAEIAHERGRQLLDLRKLEGDAAARSRQLARQALLDGHPYGIPGWGLKETLARLTSSQVKDWYQQSIAHQFPLAVLVGDTDGSALISSIVGREIKRGELQKSFKASVPAPLGTVRVESEKRSGSVSYQTLSLLGAPGDSGDHLALRVAALMWAGIGSGAHSALRQLGTFAEMKVLYQRNLLPGTWEVQIIHPAGGEEKIRSSVAQDLSRAGEKGLSQGDLDYAKSAFLGDYLVSGMDLKWRLLRYAEAALHGTPVEDIDSWGNQIGALTTEKLQAILSKYLKPDRGGWGVVQATP